MYQLWQGVRTYVPPQVSHCPWAGGSGESGPGSYHIQDGLLRLILEHGHSALRADDEDADVIEAMVLVRDTLNSNRDLWPETHGYTEAEWAEVYAEGDRRRAAQAAAEA